MTEPARSPLPLHGLRVLDFTQVIAGPFCTTMLADMGAEVVKVERPGAGDSLRAIGRYKGREHHEDYFNANNRSKKSILLDLKAPADRDLAVELAANADVAVENFAPGNAGRLGIGYADLSARNPALVYCSISGFGQTGPGRTRTALDPVVQAVAGLMSVTGEAAGDPLMAGAPLADVIAGMYGAYTILAALRTAERTGAGQYIDISMQSALLAALGPRMGETLQAGVSPERHGNQNPMRAPADSFRTVDGFWLSVICHDDGQWEPLCRAVGRADWALLPDFRTNRMRSERRGELHRMFREAFATRTLAEWESRLEAARVPYGAVNDYAGALADAQIAHRKQIRSVTHPVSGQIRLVGPPWHMPGVEADIRSPPLLGEHTAEVLRHWIGRDAGALDAKASAPAAIKTARTK